MAKKPTREELEQRVIHIHKISVDDAVDIICHTAGLNHFQATPESKKAMEDLTLSAEVKAALADMNHGMEVSTKDGVVSVRMESTIPQQSPLLRELEKIAKDIPGIKDIKIAVEPIFPFSE